MPFQESVPGVLEVVYASSADLEVEQQAALVARLEEKRGAVVIVFEVAAEVRAVPINVPTFWLGITARRELQIRGMAIVTKAMSVRVAARGFGLAYVARGIPTSVRAFEVTAEALSWAGGLLSP